MIHTVAIEFIGTSYATSLSSWRKYEKEASNFKYFWRSMAGLSCFFFLIPGIISKDPIVKLSLVVLTLVSFANDCAFPYAYWSTVTDLAWQVLMLSYGGLLINVHLTALLAISLLVGIKVKQAVTLTQDSYTVVEIKHIVWHAYAAFIATLYVSYI